MKRVVVLALWLCVFALSTLDLRAYREGYAGVTSTGCGGNGCHANQPSTLTTVLLEGERLVNPNTVYTYTLRVRNSSAIYAGFNLAAYDTNGQAAGMLQYPTTENQYVKVLNGELTHRERRTMSNKGTYREASWQVQWRTPETPGRYTIRAVGLAGDGDGRASAADVWNYLPTTTLTVRGIVLNAPTTSTSYCTGDTVTLQWISYGITTTNLLYSSNGGTSWIPVTTLEAQEGANTYRYVIPQSISAGSNHVFRITSADDELIGANTPALTINPRTAIRTQPQSPGARCEGGSVTLSLSATGASLSYQWKHNGTPVPGATSPQWPLSNLRTDQSGEYVCVVSGACGTVTSNPVTLTVTPLPKIAEQSTDTTLSEGTAVELFVRASSDSGIAYQWLKNGTPIAGATTARWRINGAPSDSGVYIARLTNTCGTAESAPIRIRITPATTVENVPSPLHSLYPQPASDAVIIETTQPVEHIELCDVRGRLLRRISVQPGNARLVLELVDEAGIPLHPGIYLITAVTGGQRFSAPLLVAPR